MPSLVTILGLDDTQFHARLDGAVASASVAGNKIASNLNEGEAHVRTGAIRETLVLLREIGRGNWSRVPGSFTLLMQQMGVLTALTGGQSNASKVLAQALQQQAERAGQAAIAAQNTANAVSAESVTLAQKARASMAAAIADSNLKQAAYEAATAAGLEGQGFAIATRAAAEKAAASAAVYEADLLAAEGAMANAEYMEAEAVSAAEAAVAIRAKAAAQMEAAAAAGAGAGLLAPLAIGLAAIAVVAIVVYEKFWGMKKALEGFKLPDANMDYVAKGLRTVDQTANAQKKVTDEVLKTMEAYNSAEAAAKRVSEATREHFEHLRRMNSFEQDPAKRAAGEINITRQEQLADTANLISQKENLEIESKRKIAQADALFKTVASEAEEKAQEKVLRDRADAAKKYLEDEANGKGHAGKALAAEFGGNPLEMGKRRDAINASIAQGIKEADQAIKSEKDFLDKQQQTKEIREKAEGLAKEGAASAARAAGIGLSLAEKNKTDAQKLADMKEEKDAEAAKQGRGRDRQDLNEHQRIGAYVADPVHAVASQQLKVQQDSHRVLTQIHETVKHYATSTRDHQEHNNAGGSW